MRDKLAVKNSMITFITQIINIVLGFVTRKLFIHYLGVELLGVNGIFTSILGALSLSELGFESAVIFRLYKPLQENRTSEIEAILSVLRRIYEWVGLFIIISGIAVSFFLDNLLNNTIINNQIYFSYFLHLGGTAITYVMAYKRTILLATQKSYIYNILISLYKIPITLMQFIAILYFKSYILYVFFNTLLMVLVNLTTAFYVNKTTTFHVISRKIDRNVFHFLITDVKNIFASKLSYYVYNSTDNLVISVFLSTTAVGMFGNYTQILYQMRTVLNQIFDSTQPVIGHFLTAEKDSSHSFGILKKYTFIRFAACVLLFVPGCVLCDCFIGVWLGDDFILPKAVTLLLITDIYIHFMQDVLVSYLNAIGYFRYDKRIALAGTAINIISSIFLVQRMGIAGVLAGTVISQIFFWFSRSVTLFLHYYHDMNTKFRNYWGLTCRYTIVFSALCLICRQLFNRIPLDHSFFKFCIGGVMCYIITIPVTVILFGKTEEFSYFVQLIKKQVLQQILHKKEV